MYTFASICPSARFPNSTMAGMFEDEQRQLGQLGKKARKDGCLSAWQQARVLGLSEAWQEMYGETTYGKARWISERVYVQGPGRKRPTPEDETPTHAAPSPTRCTRTAALAALPRVSRPGSTFCWSRYSNSPNHVILRSRDFYPRAPPRTLYRCTWYRRVTEVHTDTHY